MNLDQRARAASDELVRTSARSVDVESRLAEMPGLRRRRTRTRMVLTAAATAVVMVIGAAWMATSTTGRDHSQPVAPNDLTINPAPVTVDDPTALRKGFVGLPPEGAVPSSPATGELVVQVLTRGKGVWVYADGRMITWRKGSPVGAADRAAAANPSASGFLEQHLTAEGVDLLRAYVVDNATAFVPANGESDSFDRPLVRTEEGLLVSASVPGCEWELGCPSITIPELWLPASAWIDQRYRAYVPSEFHICYGSMQPVTAEQVRAAFPPDAARLLGAPKKTEGLLPGSVREECAVVGISDARTIDRAFQEADFQHLEGSEHYAIHYVVDVPPQAGQTAVFERSAIFQPVLPHGESTCTGCG